MKKGLPKLSIIIPCFNSKKTLEEAFFSIINSSMSVDFEVVLVDDFSTDSRASII
ncbi:glycosyltransferase [Flavobacteriaceae bacterium]|nr:glycosyltransferase [Flavobacteriaceae bacterium]